MQFGAGLAEHNRSISGHRSSGNPITPKEVYVHETGNYFVSNNKLALMEKMSQGVLESYSGLASPVKNIVISKSPGRNRNSLSGSPSPARNTIGHLAKNSSPGQGKQTVYDSIGSLGPIEEERRMTNSLGAGHKKNTASWSRLTSSLPNKKL